MSKKKEDEKSRDFEEMKAKYEKILEQDNIAAPVRAKIIESRYRLPFNIHALKTELYYDLLDKFHALRQAYSLLKQRLQESEAEKKILKDDNISLRNFIEQLTNIK